VHLVAFYYENKKQCIFVMSFVSFIFCFVTKCAPHFFSGFVKNNIHAVFCLACFGFDVPGLFIYARVFFLT